MNRNYKVYVLTVALLLANLCGRALGRDYYVSLDGNDGQPGTLEQPFRTIERAQEAVRALVSAGLKEDVHVNLRAGTYTLESTLAFDLRDSGTAAHSVNYQAWQDEKVVLSGGRVLAGKWEKHEGNIWRLLVPGVAGGKVWFRQLFIEEAGGITRCTRARWPNTGNYIKINGVCDNQKLVYGVSKALPGQALNAANHVEAEIFTSWVSSRVRIASATSNLLQTASLPGHAMTKPSRGASLFLEHAYAFIDQPREWYLDEKSGMLFFMAKAGEDPNTLEFRTGRLNKLLQVTGKASQRVMNLNFRKLAFRYSMWPLPEIGYGDMWTGNYGGPMGREWVKHVPLALENEYVQNCTFESCEVSHMGGSGLGFGRGAVSNRVVGCHVFDISAIGINFGWRSNVSTNDGWVEYDRVLKTDVARAWGSKESVPADNAITDNLVHHCGQVYEGCAGIFLAFNNNFDISYNTLYGLPYGCIIHQHFTGERERCVTSYNQIYDGMLMLGDGGAIYQSVTDTGAHIHHNFIHDIVRRPGAIAAGNNGIFLDDLGNNALVESNSFANIVDGEIRINNSKMHTIRNNFGAKRVPNAAENDPRKLTEDEIEKLKETTGPREPYRSRLRIK